MKVNSDYFGDLTFSPDESTYVIANLTLNGRTSKCGLHVHKDYANPEMLLEALAMLKRLPEFDQKSRDHFMRVCDQDEDVLDEYIDFHLEEALVDIERKVSIKNPSRQVVAKHLDLCAFPFVSIKIRRILIWFVTIQSARIFATRFWPCISITPEIFLELNGRARGLIRLAAKLLQLPF